jgi:hypothetical protein
MVLGWWRASLPAKLEKESVGIIEKYKHLEPETNVDENASSKKKA